MGSAALSGVCVLKSGLSTTIRVSLIVVPDTSAFHRAALRYLEKEYRECMARGEEPPFDLEDLLRRYGSSPPNSELSAPPSSSAPARNPLEHFAFQRKDG